MSEKKSERFEWPIHPGPDLPSPDVRSARMDELLGYCKAREWSHEESLGALLMAVDSLTEGAAELYNAGLPQHIFKRYLQGMLVMLSEVTTHALRCLWQVTRPQPKQLSRGSAPNLTVN